MIYFIWFTGWIITMGLVVYNNFYSPKTSHTLITPTICWLLIFSWVLWPLTLTYELLTIWKDKTHG